MLRIFYLKINVLPEPNNSEYISKYEQNKYALYRDETLDYISDLFKHYTESFIPSLGLVFEYWKKKPKFLPELIRRIREKLFFDEDDYQYGFQRQVDFRRNIQLIFKLGIRILNMAVKSAHF